MYSKVSKQGALGQCHRLLQASLSNLALLSFLLVPMCPRELMLSALSTTVLQASWNGAAGVAWLQLMLRGADGTNVTAVVRRGTTNHTFRNLIPGTRYELILSATAGPYEMEGPNATEWTREYPRRNLESCGEELRLRGSGQGAAFLLLGWVDDYHCSGASSYWGPDGHSQGHIISSRWWRGLRWSERFQDRETQRVEEELNASRLLGPWWAQLCPQIGAGHYLLLLLGPEPWAPGVCPSSVGGGP